jgi:hypothetical protein
MTLQEALKITGIREDELNRISVEALDDVIQGEYKEASIFRWDDKITRRIEAYKTIRKEVAK